MSHRSEYLSTAKQAVLSQAETNKRARSIPESARRAGISRSTIYIELKSGKLKSFHIGKRHLIHDDDFEEWLAAHRAENTAQR